MQPYEELLGLIKDAVREEAQGVPVFRDTGNGAIRILGYPLCEEADKWFGGLGDFRSPKPDIPDYEVTYAIAPGGSRVITTEWDGKERIVDTYSYSASKVAHCSRAQDLGKGLLSGYDLGPLINEEAGYGPYLGALCIEVQRARRDSLEPSPWCYIYVCVSGANPRDDLRCAFAAVGVIADCFMEASDENAFLINSPTKPIDL